ncbi:MAG: methyltransferase family protein [Minisyncoccia bacterium]
MQPVTIVGICWSIFIAVWFISALFAKRTIARTTGPWIFRIIVIIAVLAIIGHGGGAALDRTLWEPWASPAIGWLGAVLCVLGIALAFWARFYLGRNWGMAGSVKDNPELVTGGPYRFIRHPIYTGIILAMAGSALTAGLWWAVVLVVAGVYFIMSARKEEALMAGTFPAEYSAYKARTKMLVPFIY